MWKNWNLYNQTHLWCYKLFRNDVLLWKTIEIQQSSNNKQESWTAKWRTCYELWPLMTFDFCKMRKHYATNKTNVSPICMPSFIHTSTIVAEKKCFSAKIHNFKTIMAPDDFWPSWKVINTYIFGKPPPHTTPVPSFKFLCSIVSEKSAKLQFLGLFSHYCPLWPLTFARGNQTEHF